MLSQVRFYSLQIINIMWTYFSNLRKFLLHYLTFYYNQYYARALTLKERNKLYLLQKNIKIIRLSSKLNHIKIWSFKIVRYVKDTNFKLKLSESM